MYQSVLYAAVSTAGVLGALGLRLIGPAYLSLVAGALMVAAWLSWLRAPDATRIRAPSDHPVAPQ